MLNVNRLFAELDTDLSDESITGISNVLVELPDGTLCDLVETYNIYGPEIHGRTAGRAVVLKIKE